MTVGRSSCCHFVIKGKHLPAGAFPLANFGDNPQKAENEHHTGTGKGGLVEDRFGCLS
jgi:hypothetical protein